MRKICFVVQRYGLEVNGGAELQCRQFAEKMSDRYDITVVTTKAIDYITWKNEYTDDEAVINGVKIRRFSTARERNINEFNTINKAFMNGKLIFEKQEREWIDKQGPYVPELIAYLKENKNHYDVFVFFTYLYYTTIIGIREVFDKAILVPEAHDEPFLKMKTYQRLFTLPKAIFYNTEEERQLIEGKFKNSFIKNDLGGAGIEISNCAISNSFREKYKLDEYIVYVGRIDQGKNCDILFDYFRYYKRNNKSNLKLVLMGKAVIDVPTDSDIVNLGFVSDEDKFNGIAESKILVLPSEFESLSIVVLEAFSLNVPVLVNGKCPVLKGHCQKSNGGLYYQGYYEFEGCLNYFLQHEKERILMGKNGKQYVDENYRWEIITKRFGELIEYVAEG